MEPHQPAIEQHFPKALPSQVLPPIPPHVPSELTRRDSAGMSALERARAEVDEMRKKIPARKASKLRILALGATQ